MTIYLVRHGSAGRRDDADPHDDSRHLDDKGRAQADAVAAVLGDAGITAVLSSPYPRCSETVAPLAGSLGLEVVLDDRLREGTSVEKAWRLLEEHVDGNVVMCSHGDVIPDLVRRNQMRGMRVPGKGGCSKGSVWTLTGWDGTRFAKGRYSRP